jgi:hypothetical protein
MAVSGAWLVAAVSALAVLFNGAIGASLHRSSTFSELAEGTVQHMQRGPRTPLSDTESRLLASVLLRAAILASVVLTAILLHVSLRWYFALPAAFVSCWAFLAGSLFLVAYQRKGVAHTTAAG